MKHRWLKTRRPLYYVPMGERTEARRWESYPCKVCINCKAQLRTFGYPAGPWIKAIAVRGDSHFRKIKRIPPCVPRPGETRNEPDPLLAMADDGGIAA